MRRCLEGIDMRKRFVLAAVFVALVFSGTPASAQSSTFEFGIDGVVRGANDSVTLVLSVDVDPAFVGLECTFTETTTNNESTHPDTDLILESNGSRIEILDVESESSSVSVGSGSLVLGETIDVSVRLGEDRVASGGFVVLVDCTVEPEPTPEPTPEVTPTPEPTPEVTPTPAPTPTPIPPTPTPIPPSGVQGIVQTPTPAAPVGGIDTGAGGVTGSGGTGDWFLLLGAAAAAVVGAGLLAVRTR